MTIRIEAIQAGERLRNPSMVAAWYGLAVLVTATIFASIDRQILVLVTEPLKHALQLSDTQIGAMNGLALSLVAGLAVFPLGWLVDRVDRPTLLAVCITVWSIFTAACGFTQSFSQLFLCAMGIAIGEAVLGPISYAIVADLFPRDKWIVANYVFFVTGSVGYAVAFALTGGVIGFVETHHAALPGGLAAFDPWRVAMFAVAIPGLPLAAMVMLVRRPTSRIARKAESTGGVAPYIREHARTFIGVFGGFGLVASTFGTIGSWVPVVLVREFAQTPAETGVRLGMVMAGASVIGVIASALLVRVLQPRIGQITPLRVAQLGVAVAVLGLPAYSAATAVWQIYAIIGVQVAATICALSLSPTVCQFMAPRLMRGRVLAVGGILNIMFQSLSPVVVGVVSDLLGTDPKSLLWAVIIVAAPCYIVGIFLLHLAERTVPATFAAAAEEPPAERSTGEAST